LKFEIFTPKLYSLFYGRLQLLAQIFSINCLPQVKIWLIYIPWPITIQK